VKGGRGRYRDILGSLSERRIHFSSIEDFISKISLKLLIGVGSPPSESFTADLSRTIHLQRRYRATQRKLHSRTLKVTLLYIDLLILNDVNRK